MKWSMGYSTGYSTGWSPPTLAAAVKVGVAVTAFGIMMFFALRNASESTQTVAGLALVGVAFAASMVATRRKRTAEPPHHQVTHIPLDGSNSHRPA